MEPRDLERIIGWLDEAVEIDRLDHKEQVKRLERLAELVYVNGGRLEVGSYGMMMYGGGPYGREGLDHREGVELMTYGGIIGGLEILAPGANQEIARRCKEVWRRVEAEAAEALHS